MTKYPLSKELLLYCYYEQHVTVNAIKGSHKLNADKLIAENWSGTDCSVYISNTYGVLKFEGIG